MLTIKRFTNLRKQFYKIFVKFVFIILSYFIYVTILNEFNILTLDIYTIKLIILNSIFLITIWIFIFLVTNNIFNSYNYFIVLVLSDILYVSFLSIPSICIDIFYLINVPSGVDNLYKFDGVAVLNGKTTLHGFYTALIVQLAEIMQFSAAHLIHSFWIILGGNGLSKFGLKERNNG